MSSSGSFLQVHVKNEQDGSIKWVVIDEFSHRECCLGRNALKKSLYWHARKVVSVPKLVFEERWFGNKFYPTFSDVFEQIAKSSLVKPLKLQMNKQEPNKFPHEWLFWLYKITGKKHAPEVTINLSYEHLLPVIRL